MTNMLSYYEGGDKVFRHLTEMKQFPQNSIKIGWPEWSQYNAVHLFIQVLLVA